MILFNTEFICDEVDKEQCTGVSQINCKAVKSKTNVVPFVSDQICSGQS